MSAVLWFVLAVGAVAIFALWVCLHRRRLAARFRGLPPSDWLYVYVDAEGESAMRLRAFRLAGSLYRLPRTQDALILIDSLNLWSGVIDSTEAVDHLAAAFQSASSERSWEADFSAAFAREDVSPSCADGVRNR